MNFKILAKITVILSIIPAVYFSFFPGKIVMITILCLYPVLIMSTILILKNGIKTFEGIKYINIFFIYSLIILIRGFLNLNSIQDYATFFSADLSMFLIMPITIYFGTKIEFYITLQKTFIFYGIILCCIIWFQTNDSGPFGFTHMISPIYFLILMIPYLSKKSILFILIITSISFFSDVTIRSNLINIILALIITFSYVFKSKKYIIKSIKIFRIFFIFLPILFLFLGLTGIFNIFAIGDSIEKYTIYNKGGNSQNLFTDSRTLIYEDVFVQLKKDNRFFFGLGAEGKTKTHLTNVENSDFDIIYKEGRRGTESGMLNYIQFGGLIGGTLYFMLFVKSSYNAIYKSNNWFMVMLGLFVSFKGFFSFIEDSSVFSISTIFIFVAIGLCFNKTLRDYNDKEIKNIFENLFIKYKLKFN